MLLATRCGLHRSIFWCWKSSVFPLASLHECCFSIYHFRKYRLFRKGAWAQNWVQRNCSGSSLKLYLSVVEHWWGKICPWITCGGLIPLCCNYSNNLERRSTTEDLSANCHRYLRRQRLFPNIEVESCSCCSTGELIGYFKRIIKIQKKLQVKVGKDFPGYLPGVCPV